jgi:hypothetical protein
VPAVEVDGGADEPDVAEGLGEVAEQLALAQALKEILQSRSSS